MVLGRPNEPQPAQAAPGQQNRARNQESRSGKQQGGHLRCADADGRISGAPEEIDAGKGQHNRGCGGLLSSPRLRLLGHRHVASSSIVARVVANAESRDLHCRMTRNHGLCILTPCYPHSAAGIPCKARLKRDAAHASLQSAGRGRARAAFARAAICACCPPALDLASSAATSTGPPKITRLPFEPFGPRKWTTPSRLGSAAALHPVSWAA